MAILLTVVATTTGRAEATIGTLVAEVPGEVVVPRAEAASAVVPLEEVPSVVAVLHRVGKLTVYG